MASDRLLMQPTLHVLSIYPRLPPFLAIYNQKYLWENQMNHLPDEIRQHRTGLRYLTYEFSVDDELRWKMLWGRHSCRVSIIKTSSITRNLETYIFVACKRKPPDPAMFIIG
jgi:hypothetical protein